ncbi:MAG TPA: hypothetical protein VNS09_00235 [Solirubrobacter sp.]|nr:hypothetical protein [Solirubrobacter sp.]
MRWSLLALFVAGVLMFADAWPLAVAGWLGTVALLFGIGFADGRLRAVLAGALLLASAFVADVLWVAGFPPFDRSADYEPLAQTPFFLLGLPVPMAVVALGVGAGALWRRFIASGR